MQSDDYMKIDQYLQGELPAAEREALEARFREEPELAAELEMRQQMDTYLRTQKQLPGLQEKMAALSQEHFDRMDKPKVRQLARRRLFYAVAVAATFALLLFVWNPFASNDLYSQFADHAPLAIVEKGGEEALATQAEQAFGAGNYQVAYEALVELNAQTSTDPQVLLALGISALETGQMTEARQAFGILAEGQTALREYGSWYLILCHLKEGDNKAALELMQQTDFTDFSLASKAGLLRQALE